MPRVTASDRIAVTRGMVKNGGFEIAPAFVAATTTGARWIDGTAAGSLTNDNYGWASQTSGSCAFQFDPSEFVSGAYSMKVSTTATNSNAICSNMLTNSAAQVNRYGIRALPSTAYIFKGWMKTNYVSGDSNSGAYIQVTERTATGSATTNNTTTIVKTTTAWTFYTKAITTNAATRFFDIRVAVTGNNGAATLIMDAWFDNIEVTPVNAGRVAASGRVAP